MKNLKMSNFKSSHSRAILQIEESKRQSIISNLVHHSNTYLDKSGVCDGVGVFALLPIKQGEQLFQDVPKTEYFFRWDELSDLDERVIQKLKSLCNYNQTGVYMHNSLNNFNFSFFVNHSETPNVFHNLKADEFFSIRNIEPGEELVCTYNSEEKDW